MIKFEQRFDANAYRIGDGTLSGTVTTLEEGQWVTYDANGELVIAGAASVHAFLAMGSKRDGRDQVAGRPVKKITFLHGPFRLKTDQFDATGTYATTMTPLTLADNGILTDADMVAGDKVYAYAKGEPVDGFLLIYGV